MIGKPCDIPHSSRHSYVHGGNDLRGSPMASSAGGSPHSPPSPPRWPHLQTKTPDGCQRGQVRPWKTTSSMGRPLASHAAAAPFTLPPDSLVCIKHPLKLSRRKHPQQHHLHPSCVATSTKPNDLRGRLVAPSAAAASAHPFPPASRPQPSRSQPSLRFTAARPRFSSFTRPCPQKRRTPRPSDDHNDHPVAASGAAAHAPFPP